MVYRLRLIAFRGESENNQHVFSSFFFLDMGLHTLPVTFDINLPLLCVLFLVNT